MTAAPLPLVFVTVGTDHHPFDRLIQWVDGWLRDGGSARARCFVQYGTSTPPGLAESRPYLSYEDMRRYIEEATAVVCHGGPGTIMTCRHHGRRPIVVPRRDDLGEHIDEHQILFAMRMPEGQIDLATDEAEFRRALERALTGANLIQGGTANEVAEAVRRFEELVAGLMARSPRRRSAGAR